jgi:Fe2+ or Zn2+ uptake regulation protein
MPDLHLIAAARLRADDQRYTANRRALVEALERAEGPITIPELLGSRGELAQSSAYRNLGILERAGVVHRIVTSDEFARFELAEDLTEHHHHLVCTTCGGVEDFTVPDELERTLDRSLEQVAVTRGFSVNQHRLDLLGTCSRCCSLC